MKILDMSAGKRNIWFNPRYRDTVFVDIRPEMRPSVVCDTRNLPFPDKTFDFISFDPPHMVHGTTSTMGKYYGCYSGDEIKAIIRDSSQEAYRVSVEECLLAFKWNDHDVRLDHTLALMEGWEPLFGHQFKRSAGTKSSTYWILLRKVGVGYGPERIYESPGYLP